MKDKQNAWEIFGQKDDLTEGIDRYVAHVLEDQAKHNNDNLTPYLRSLTPEKRRELALQAVADLEQMDED